MCFLAYPSGPIIKNMEDNLVYKLVKGTEAVVKCSGINGFPQPKVTWFDGQCNYRLLKYYL